MYNNESFEENLKKSHSDVVEHFKELPFYNEHIKKPKIKCLKTIDLFTELPFYEEMNAIKTNYASRGYAISYKVEIIWKKDPIRERTLST